MKTRARAGGWVVTAVAVVYGFIEIEGVRDHVRHSQWPPHSDYHAMTGLFALLAALVTAIVLIWRYVRSGDRVAWSVVTLIGIAIFGGGLLADPLTGGGLRKGGEALVGPATAVGLVSLALAAWLVGVALLWPSSRSTEAGGDAAGPQAMVSR